MPTPLRPDLKSLNKRDAPKLFAFSKITQPLTFVLSNISETRSWIQNHRKVLHKQNQNYFLKSHTITFYTAKSYHPTILVQYEGPGVSTAEEGSLQ